MLLSRSFINQVTSTTTSPVGVFSLPRLFQQTKQKSQILAYIWYWGSDTLEENDPNYDKYQNAVTLAEYYQYPEENPLNGERTLKKLLSTIPKSDGTEVEKLLYAVFPFDSDSEYPDHYFFPILDEGEQEFYKFSIDTNIFQGFIEDPKPHQGAEIHFVVPYPPCPKFSEITVTKAELDEWVSEYSSKPIPDNIYIPLCST